MPEKRKPKSVVDYAQEAAQERFRTDTTFFQGSYLEGDILRSKAALAASRCTLITCNRIATWRLVARETYVKTFIVEYERLVKEAANATKTG